jgi:hypothetical protein
MIDVHVDVSRVGADVRDPFLQLAPSDCDVFARQSTRVLQVLLRFETIIWQSASTQLFLQIGVAQGCRHGTQETCNLAYLLRSDHNVTVTQQARDHDAAGHDTSR